MKVGVSKPPVPESVVAWRIERLIEAGYPVDVAWELGDDVTVDLRQAIYLLESGCPLATALRILR